jgi:hypothetical protein
MEKAGLIRQAMSVSGSDRTEAKALVERKWKMWQTS